MSEKIERNFDSKTANPALKPVLTDDEVQAQVKTIPIYMQGTPPKILQYGLKYGLIRIGWAVRDYLSYAVQSMGYETAVIWGVQSAGKSNRMLQHGYWIYRDWDLVLRNIVFKPSDFVQKLQSLPMGKRIPWIGWDDVGVHYPSVSWRTHIEMYESIDACWTAVRTKASVVSLTIPLIDRLAKNLKDNVTIEEYCGRNQMILSERYIRLPGIREKVESNFRKVQIEPAHRFNIFNVPTSVFKEYWDRRLELTEEALDKLAKTVGGEPDTVEGYISVLEASKILGVSPRSVGQLCNEGVVLRKKINGRLHIPNEDFEYLKEYYLSKKKRKKTKEST